jgi:transposase-like protein
VVKENNERTTKSTPIFEELEEFVRGRVQKMIQSIVDEEVEEFLGRMKYERKSKTESAEGYRNGYAPPSRLLKNP